MTNSVIFSLRDEDLGRVSGGAASQDQALWDEMYAGGGTNGFAPKGDKYGKTYHPTWDQLVGNDKLKPEPKPKKPSPKK